MKRPRPHLPAAVVEDQNAPVARVVPLTAAMVTVGSAKLGYMHRPARRQGVWTRNMQRLAEVERLRVYRATMTVEHGLLFPADDEAFLRSIMPELLLEARLPNRPHYRANAITWATAITPCLVERGHEWFDAVTREFDRPRHAPRPLRADAIAKLLGVSWEERQACGLTTIGAVDMTKAQRRAEARKSDAAYQESKRRATGSVSRDEYRSGSLSAARPWQALGLSRAAWYRQKSAAETSPSATFEAGFVAPETSPSGPYVIHRPPMDLSQPADAVQLSLLPDPHVDAELRAACEAWMAGPMPPAIVTGYIAAKRRRAVRQDDVAKAIVISRPQLANALHRTFNLSPDVIARMKLWLLTDDADLPPALAVDEVRPARSHHRRGGKRPPDPGPVFPTLRLFSVIENPRSVQVAPEPEEMAA